MIRTLERITTDAYIKRIMEEQDFYELEVNLLLKTIEQQVMRFKYQVVSS